MATTIASKNQILEDAGFIYSFSRDIYLNRTARAVFSLEFVEDHSETEIKELLAAPRSNPSEWVVHFNEGPSASVKRELLKLIANGVSNH